MNLNKIQTELKKRREFPYRWGRKQNDYWDKLTSFIYHIDDWEMLIQTIKSHYEHIKNKSIDYKDFFDYAINRWFNFWSAHAVEDIFISLPHVQPALNKYDRLVDFSIRGIKFDHKTSVFPRAFPDSFANAKANPKNLIRWLYKNQSQQQRKHLKNRLFIILYDKKGGSWKLRSEILGLKQLIENYIENFDEAKLFKFNFEKNQITYSDVIWAERKYTRFKAKLQKPKKK